MSEIVLKGLDIKALNSLIWHSAVLLKFSIIIVGIYAVILVGTITLAFLIGD